MSPADPSKGVPEVPETPERQFKGVWICAELWESAELTWTEKALLAEVDSLSGRGKACFASNKHLAERLKVTEVHMKEMLASLTDLAYLVRLDFDGRKTLRCVNPEISSNPLASKHLMAKHNVPESRSRIKPKAEGRYRFKPKAEEGQNLKQGKGKTQTEISSRETQKETQRETTTTPRAKGMHLVAEQKGEVVVVSSCVVEEEPEEPSKGEEGYWPDEDDSPVADQSPWPDDEAEEELPTVTKEQKTASAAVDAIATEFGLGVVGRGEIQHYLGLKGFAYVQAKATLAKSAPRSNIGGYFLAALKNDWHPPKSTAPAPKTKGPTEPAGWREGLRAVARSRYPGADPEAWSYWKNVPRSLQVEVLAELARPTAASEPPVATGPAKVDLEAMREAVRNVGKEAAA